MFSESIPAPRSCGHQRLAVVVSHLFPSSSRFACPQFLQTSPTASINKDKVQHSAHTTSTTSTTTQYPSLSHQSCSSSVNNNIQQGVATENHKATFNVPNMVAALRGGSTNLKARKALLQLTTNQIFQKKYYNLTKEEARDLTDAQVSFLLGSGLFSISDMKKDVNIILQSLEVVGLLPGSVSIKIGVQLILFGGSILNLGTSKHHEKYAKRAERFELPGCFAMTELAHGSNVRKLETTATYDPSKEEFIINTPNDGAVKWWIGNAQKNAIMATVFARLITKGKDYGIHAILVPIRDEKTKLALPGVEIGDCGDKAGLHGIDNGFLRFTNVRVPRENLLNRFGDVEPDGTYVSDIKDDGKRFAAVLGELITGRLSLVSTSLNIRKIAITIAIRYGATRVQFGPKISEPEQAILDYRSHQIRLMPILASCYGVEFARRILLQKYVKLYQNEYADKKDDILAEVHALAAGMKSMTTWDTQAAIQTCRECCGGHGFAAYNRFGTLRSDHDIFLTFEGDNMVLIQQLAGYLLKEYSEQFKGSQILVLSKYFRKRMGVLVRDRNFVVTRISSETHLKSSDWQLQAFGYRTAKLLERVASKLNKNRKKMGFWNAWNDLVPAFKHLVQAYTEQFILEEFVKQVEGTEDIEIRKILKTLCDLYALSRITGDILGFFDILKRNKVKAIQTLVEQLCEDVREHAVSLVDAFDIPDFFIDAPIGLSKGDYIQHTLNYAKVLNPNNHSFPIDDQSLEAQNVNTRNSPLGPDDSEAQHEVILNTSI